MGLRAFMKAANDNDGLGYRTQLALGILLAVAFAATLTGLWMLTIRLVGRILG